MSDYRYGLSDFISVREAGAEAMYERAQLKPDGTRRVDYTSWKKLQDSICRNWWLAQMDVAMQFCGAALASDGFTYACPECGPVGDCPHRAFLNRAAEAAQRPALDEAGVVEQVQEALQHAQNTFYRYAELHQAKGTDEGDYKACANASMGEEMGRALNVLAALSPPPVVEEAGNVEFQQGWVRFNDALQAVRSVVTASASLSVEVRTTVQSHLGAAIRNLYELQRAPTPPAGEEAVEQRADILSRTETWLRECSSWLLSSDLDMQCPMETDPLDLADDLKTLAALPSPSPGLTIPDELQELSEKATAGPWRIGRMGDETLQHVVDMGEPPSAPFMALSDGAPASSSFTGFADSGVCHSDDGSSEANAAFIAAAVNFIRQALSNQEPSHVR